MAEIDAFVKSRHRQIRAGDEVDIEITISLPKSRDDIALEWKVGWQASGRATDETIVARGSERIDHIEAGEARTWTIPFTVPRRGPVSYQGTLVSLRWLVRASIDIPWALDPKAVFAFDVFPRRLRPKRETSRAAGAKKRRAG